MCSGVVNVRVRVAGSKPATSLISAVGRSERLNHPAAAGKGSSKLWGGLWRWYTTRKSGDAQISPRPVGSLCQEAFDSSSRSTICPGANEAGAVASRTDLAPLIPSAARLYDVPPLPQRDEPTTITGFAAFWTYEPGRAPFVRCSSVAFA